MKAQELRIGNLVISADFSIQEVEALTTVCHFKNSGTNRFEVIKGIPLTEEWLVRFGFEKRDDIGWDIPFQGHPKHIRFIEYKFMSEEPLAQPFLRYDDTHTDIYFVHTLQNLFYAICGEELTAI